MNLAKLNNQGSSEIVQPTFPRLQEFHNIALHINNRENININNKDNMDNVDNINNKDNMDHMDNISIKENIDNKVRMFGREVLRSPIKPSSIGLSKRNDFA